MPKSLIRAPYYQNDESTSVIIAFAVGNPEWCVLSYSLHHYSHHGSVEWEGSRFLENQVSFYCGCQEGIHFYRYVIGYVLLVQLNWCSSSCSPTAFTGSATFLLLCGYLGTSTVTTVLFLTLASMFSSLMLVGANTNHLDIAPKYAGVLWCNI